MPQITKISSSFLIVRISCFSWSYVIVNFWTVGQTKQAMDDITFGSRKLWHFFSQFSIFYRLNKINKIVSGFISDENDATLEYSKSCVLLDPNA